MRIINVLKILIIIASISFHTSRHSKNKNPNEEKLSTDCTYKQDLGIITDTCGEGLICVTEHYSKSIWFSEFIEAKGLCLKISDTENITCTAHRECASFYCIDNICKVFTENTETGQRKIKLGERCYRKFQCEDDLECNGENCGEKSDDAVTSSDSQNNNSSSNKTNAATNKPNNKNKSRGDPNGSKKLKFKKLKIKL